MLWLLLLFSNQAFATDLGQAGNQEVVRLFRNYQTQVAGCDASLPGRRVLLTGFGRFQSIKLNFAGALVTNIANPDIWPEETFTSVLTHLRQTYGFHDGLFLTQQGAQHFNRQLVIDGEPINLCVLVLDVLWDIAGAIVAHEMDRFQPQSVLMLGGGGGPMLEGGALNYADDIEGYYADGAPSRTNMPKSPQMLRGLPQELPMLWDNLRLRQNVEHLLREAKFELNTTPRARRDNTYLCNHVSYVALATARNLPLELAGGALLMHPHLAQTPQVGFFHLPWSQDLTQETLEGWGSVVLALIHGMGR